MVDRVTEPSFRQTREAACRAGVRVAIGKPRSGDFRRLHRPTCAAYILTEEIMEATQAPLEAPAASGGGLSVAELQTAHGRSLLKSARTNVLSHFEPRTKRRDLIANGIPPPVMLGPPQLDAPICRWYRR